TSASPNPLPPPSASDFRSGAAAPAAASPSQPRDATPKLHGGVAHPDAGAGRNHGKSPENATRPQARSLRGDGHVPNGYRRTCTPPSSEPGGRVPRARGRGRPADAPELVVPGRDARRDGGGRWPRRHGAGRG